MNLAQLRTQLRDIITAGGGTNVNTGSDDFWSDSELNTYINMAQQELYKIIRRARSDYFMRVLKSTDSSLVIMGQLFDPSTLRWVAGTGTYIMPPDFVRMRMITDLATDQVRLVGSDIAKNQFRIIMNSSSSQGVQEYLYDILGVRSLIIRPVPQEVKDFEFIYEKALAPLRDWSTGSISLTNNSSIATFSASANIQNQLNVGDEIIAGIDAANHTTPEPDAHYPVVRSIDSATQVTLARVYLGTTVSNAVYRASSVSEIPLQHQYMLVCKAAVLAFKKGTNPSTDAAALWQSEFDSMVPGLVNDVESRQGSDLETSEAYLEDFDG